MSLRNITPEEFRCVAAACPAVYAEDESDTVLVVGKKADLEKMGLDKEKVGDDEVAAVIDKEMLRKVANSL